MADIEEMRKRGYTGPDLSGLVSNNDAASSLGLAQGANPDQEAQIRGAAKTAGLPIPIANANPDIVRGLAQKVEAMNALKQAPKTADYLSNVQNAKIAHDDVPALAGVEAAEKENIYSNGVWSAGFKLAKRFAKGLRRTEIGLDSAIHSQIGGFFENMAETVTNPYLKEPLQNAAEFFFRQEIEGQKRMNDITRKYFEDPKMDLPEELRGRLIDNPEMVLDPKWLAVNMTDFASSFVPMIAATMIGGPVAGGVAGGALEGSDLYNQLRELGTSTEDAGAAMIAFGVVTGVLNKIGADRLLAKMPVGNMASRMMHRIVTGATEAGSEYMEEPFQAAFASIAQGKNLESTAEAVLQSLSNIEVIPGAFLMGAALNSTISESKRRTESSTAYANRITSISNALTGSKLKERSPEDTESFLRTLGVREDLYISPEGVQALFQADPQILEKLGLDPAKALEDAQTGQDSRVPAAAVLARLLPEEVALFQQDIKPSPGAFTMRDMKAKVDAEEVSRLTAAAGTAIREEIDFGAEVDRIIGEARTAIDGLENFKGVNTEEYLAQYRTILERFANRWAVGTGKDRIQFLQKIQGVMQKYFIESGQSIPTEYLSLSQRMAETPEFKQWFRESKVVDAEGKPLVVYHGTRSGEFAEFDPAKKGSNTFHKGDEVGFHFTTDNQDASVYAGQYAKPRNAWPEKSRIISAYVSIQNPLVLNSGTVTKEDIARAKSEGRDGIIANAGAYGHKEIVAFSPTQIKSVNNRGAWDMRNPNIFWQTIKQTPEFKQWFRESKVVDEQGKPRVMYHWTDSDFDEFDLSASGGMIHFGTKRAALDRAGGASGIGYEIDSDSDGYWVYADAGPMDGKGQGPFGSQAEAKAFIKKQPRHIEPMAVFLKIEHPLRVPDFGVWTIDAVRTYLGNKGIITGKEADEIWDAWQKSDAEAYKVFRGVLARHGFDGFVYKNEQEDAGRDSYVAFDPTQIKSVNNRGTWDMRNPNIFWQTIKQMPEFAEFFRDTKVVDEQGNPLMVHHSGTFRTEEDEAFDTTAGVHFGTLDAARARMSGKAVDDALLSIETYQNDSGLWGFEIDGVDYEGDYESEAEAQEAAEDLAATTDIDLPWEDAEEGITSVYLNLKNPKYVGDQGNDWSAAIAQAKEQGYDGLMYRNLYEDAGSISYVAFYPEQIKHVNNLRPTADPRIMFQGEETRMSVLHNLSAENLLFADKMGGLALPSLGVVTSDVAYTGFGDITLIGNPELGDPTQVPIFDADAFTARFPQPEYSKAKAAVAQRIVDRVRPWAEKHDRHVIDGTWEYLTQHPSMGNLRSLWQRSNATRAMFLEEEYGTKVDPVMRPKGARNVYSLEPAMIKFVKGLGEWWNLDPGKRETMLVDAGEAFKKSVHSHYRKVYKALFPNLMDDAEIDRLVVHDPAVADALSKHLDDKGALFFSSFDTISNDIAAAGKMVVDEFATRNKLEKLLQGKEGAFEKWLDKMLSGKLEMHLKLQGKKVPYTLDNIVKAMTKRGVKGKEDMGSMFTEGLLRAMTAFRFPSVSRMRKGAAEQIRSEKEVSEARVKTQAALTDYRDALSRYYAYPDYMAMANDAMKAFSMLGKRRDRAALRSALSRLDFKNVPDDILDQGLEAFEMFLHTPVPFFEGKPQRAVKLDEFVGAVVPEDASPEVLDVLKKNGLVIKTYPPRTAIGDEKAQAQAVREFREELEAEGQQVFFQDSTDLEPVRNEIVTALAKRPWTLKLFNDPQMKGKEGKVIKVQTIQQTMKQQKYSKIEKELVEVALQSQLLAGKDAVPFDQFRYVVENLLFPLETKVSTGHYGDYGLANIGAEKKNAVAILYNGPVEHGVTGHFSGDYKTTREARKFVAKATGEPGVYVAMDEARPAGITDPAMLINYVGDVGTKEEVESWIREYNARAASPKGSGLFCHARRNDEGGVRHITELQSDFYQKNHPVVTLVDMIQKDPKSAAQVQAVRQLEKLNDAVSAFSPVTIEAIIRAQRSARSYRKSLKENEARLEQVEKEIEEAREKQDAMMVDLLDNEKKRLLESIVSKQRQIESAEKGRVNGFEYNYATGEVGYIDDYEILPRKSRTWNENSLFIGVPNESSLRLGMRVPTHVILKVREDEVLGQPIYFTETDKQSAREYAYEIKEKDEFEGRTSIKYDIVPVSGDAPQIQEFRREYQDIIKSYNSAARARDKFVMEGFTVFFTPLQKQLVAQREKYPLRILREEIRAAAQAGSPFIRIAKPYTLAAIEGYISPLGPAPAPRVQRYIDAGWAPAPGVDMDNLRPGDVIEIDGIDKIVVEEPRGGEVKVVAESEVLGISVEEITDSAIETDIDWSLEEIPDKLKFVVLRTSAVEDEDSGQLRLPGTEVFFKEVKYDSASIIASEIYPGYSFALAEDELSEDSYGVASRIDLIDAIRDRIEDGLTGDLQDSLEKGEFSHGDTFTLEVRGRYADIDLEDFIRDLVEKEVNRRWDEDWEQMTEDYLGYYAAYFWERGDGVQYVREDDDVEELPIPIISEDAPSADEKSQEREPDYMGEGLSPEYAGIVQKYAELGKLLAKELPDGYGVHVDKNGFGWYESKVPPERADEPVTLFQVTGRRAAVTIRKDGYLINMFQGADPSSLVHETAHVFLEEMKEAVMNGTATKEFEQDYLAVLKWTGNTSGNLTVADHEKFAKGFEAYLQEGKAPSMEMEPVFASFRRWLTAVYKEAKKQLGVKLNNEVRRIFDRMITAETSTRQTSLDMFSALKTDEELTALNVSGEDRDYLRRLLAKAQQTAEENLIKAKAKSLRQNMKRMREDAKAEVDEDQLIADQLSKAGGLNRQELLDAYGPSILDTLPGRVPPLATNNGVPLEAAAAAGGFVNVSAMIRKLEGMKPKAEAVDAALNRMIEEHDQKFQDPTPYLLETKEFQDYLDIIAKYYRQERKPSRQIYADRAKAILGLKRVPDAIRHDLPLQAMRRAQSAERKALLAGNLGEAQKANAQQLLNLAMVKQAMKNRKVWEQIQRRARAYSKSGGINVEYREVIRDIIGRFGIIEGMAAQAPDKLKPLASMIQGDGTTVDPFPASDFLLHPQLRSYRDLSFDELQEVGDLLNYLASQGRDINKTLLEDGKTTVEQAAIESAEETADLKSIKVRQKFSLLRKLNNFTRGTFARLNSLNFIAIAKGGYQNIGSKGVKSKTEGYIFDPLVKAQAAYDLAVTADLTALQPHMDQLYKTLQAWKKQFGVRMRIQGANTPSLLKLDGQEGWWTGEQILAIALNQGNAGNQERILAGYPDLTQDTVNKLLDLLSKEDWDAIQGIWDLIDSKFQAIDAVHTKLQNFHMRRTPPDPVRTKFGLLRGGYYPAVYDPFLSVKVAEFTEADDLLARSEAIRQVPAAKSGMTKNRVAGVRLPIKLSLGVVTSHLSDVNRYITHAEPVRNIDRIIRNRTFADETIRVLGKEVYDMIRPALKYAARPVVETTDAGLDRVISWLRGKSTAFALAWNIGVAIQQPAASFSGIYEIGGTYYAKGLAASLVHPASLYQTIVELSPYMASRAKNRTQEMREMFDRMTPDQRRIHFGNKSVSWAEVQNFGFWPIQLADMATVIPIWQGAFTKGLDENNGDVDAAVAYADGIIRKTQGSAQPIDLTHWQRMGGAARLFSLFSTFTIGTYGQRQRLHFRAWKAGKVSSLEYAWFNLCDAVLPALTLSLSYAVIYGVDFDDDEWKEIAKDVAKYMLLTGIPVVGQLFSPYGRVLESPVGSGLEETKKLLQRGSKLIEEDFDQDAVNAVVWQMLAVVSFFSGVPVSRLVEKYRKGLEQDQEIIPGIKYIVPAPKNRRN